MYMRTFISKPAEAACQISGCYLQWRCFITCVPKNWSSTPNVERDRPQGKHKRPSRDGFGPQDVNILVVFPATVHNFDPYQDYQAQGCTRHFFQRDLHMIVDPFPSNPNAPILPDWAPKNQPCNQPRVSSFGSCSLYSSIATPRGNGCCGGKPWLFEG